MTEEDFWDSMESLGDNECLLLILADWLDENGQSEKAEWIRRNVEEGGLIAFDEWVHHHPYFETEVGYSFWDGSQEEIVCIDTSPLNLRRTDHV